MTDHSPTTPWPFLQAQVFYAVPYPPLARATELLVDSIVADEDVADAMGNPSLEHFEDYAADLHALCEGAWVARMEDEEAPDMVCRAAAHVVAVLTDEGYRPGRLVDEARKLGSLARRSRAFLRTQAETLLVAAEAVAHLVDLAVADAEDAAAALEARGADDTIPAGPAVG